jgi:hypothetical protein
METGQPSSLQMPSFLHGSFRFVSRETQREGHRCGEQFRRDGSFPALAEMEEVPSGEVVIAHEVVDLHPEQPAWRMYMLSGVMRGVYEALDFQNSPRVRDAFEAFCRRTAWGALHFSIEQNAPRSAAHASQRLQAVLRFWEPLQSVRYLFKELGVVLTLEKLMIASCGWVMDAWCPVDEESIRKRLEVAVERMARATREDCIHAILRQMPRAFEASRGLKHRDVLVDPTFLRERLMMLEPGIFERVSGACTSDLLGQLYAWDRQLEKQ